MNTGTFFRLSTLGALLLGFVACGNDNDTTTATAVPSPTPSASPTPEAANVVVTIDGMKGNQSFSPNPATVKVGQTVSWKNADVTAHTATADKGEFDTGNIAPGATSKPIAMKAAGAVAYHCSIHPTMVGTLKVQ